MQKCQSPISGKESSRTTRKLNGSCSNLSQGKVRDAHIKFSFSELEPTTVKDLSVNQNRKQSTFWILEYWIKKSNECLKVINFTQWTSTQISKEKSALQLKVEQSWTLGMMLLSQYSVLCHLFYYEFCFQGTRMSLTPLFPVMYRAILTSH